ncbi:hypothetical protein ACFSL6_27175 [Paenibacillus thailandensis]
MKHNRRNNPWLWAAILPMLLLLAPAATAKAGTRKRYRPRLKPRAVRSS